MDIIGRLKCLEKEKKEMKIKDFVERYNAIATDRLKEDYLKDNLHIKTYLPFLRKDAIATVLVDRSTYKFEPYTKEDGTTGRRRTNQIQVNSTAQMLLFYRVIIENYTDLEVETEGFYEEYDALNESGVLFELTADFEGHPSLIPAREISELRGMIKMKQEDEIFNRTEIHNYITEQIDRFSNLTNVISKPIMDIISERLENETDEESSNNTDDYLEVVK